MSSNGDTIRQAYDAFGRGAGGPVEYGLVQVFEFGDGKVARFSEYADRVVG